MTNNFIPGGYILLSRRLIESEIWDKPPMYLKVWIYILTKARHKATQRFERGELLISIPELQEACSHKVGYRTVKPTKDQIYNILEWLRSVNERGSEYNDEDDTNTTMITTTKTTRGLIVKVRNYNVYQDPKNYEDNGEHNNENTTKTTAKTLRRQRQPDTIHKNVKNVEESKKEKNVSSSNNDDFRTVVNMYQENIELNPAPVTFQKIQQDFSDYGKDIMIYAIKKSALKNNHNYSFINYLLNDWKKKQLTTVDEIKQSEHNFEFKKQATYSKQNQQKEMTPSWINQENTQKQDIDEEELERERQKLLEELNSSWENS